MSFKLVTLLVTAIITLNLFAQDGQVTMGDILSKNHCTIGNMTLTPEMVDYSVFREGEVRHYLGSFGEPTGLFIRRYVTVRINQTIDERGPYYYLHLKMYHNLAAIMPKEFEHRYTPAELENSEAYLVEYLKSPCSNLYRKKMKLIDDLREMGADRVIIDDYNERPGESCEDLAEVEQLARSLENLEIKVMVKSHPLRKDIHPLQLRCNFLNF